MLRFLLPYLSYKRLNIYSYFVHPVSVANKPAGHYIGKRVQPSWFPGFEEYTESHLVKTNAVYLSLGDREEKTRNPLPATVGDAVRSIHQTLRGNGISCTLEWNEGNHFREPDKRTAKGFAWLLTHSAQ